MKVSIIVAVYNTEQYLEKCLISLMGQTHRDIEILCVDFLNRKYLSKEDKDYCLYEMKRIWKGIETFRIPTMEKLKLGYYPFRYSWSLFRIQEEIYFILKSILHKI